MRLALCAIAFSALLFAGCGDSAQPTSTASTVNTSKAAPTPPKLGVAREELMFKGIPIGKPGQVEAVLALWSAKDNSYRGRPKRLDKSSSTRFNLSYSDFDAFGVKFSFGKDGVLDEVWFQAGREQLATLIGSLTEKYGPPRLDESTVSNAMGAKFQSADATWVDAKGTELNVSTTGSQVNMGSFMLRSAKKIKEDHDEYDQKQAAAKRNL